MPLRLKLDPSQLISGAQASENALDDVKESAVQAESAVERLGRASAGTSAPLRGAARTSSLASRGFAALGSNARLMTMQLSQVAQQGAATGNFLQALIIQAPDLALGFGAVGIAIGAAIPILYAAGQALFNVQEEALTLDEAMGELEGSTRSLISIYSLATDSQKTLAQAYRTTIEAARELHKIEVAQAVREQSDALQKIISTALGASEALGQVNYAAHVYSQTQSKNTLVAEAAEKHWSSMSDSLQIAALSLMDLRAQMEGGNTTAEEMRGTLQDLILGINGLDDASFDGLLGQLSSVLRKLAATADAADDASDAVNRLAKISAQNRADALVQSGGRGQNPSLFLPGGALANYQNAAGYTPIDDVIERHNRANRRGSAGGGGGASSADQTRKAYENLIKSLDPLTRASMDYADAQKTINEALARGHITGEEAARANELAADRFEEMTERAKQSASVWDRFRQAGGSAIDRMIEGTTSLTEGLKDMIKELVLAIARKRALASIDGATADMSLGSMLFQGLFGGFLDQGGTIGMGQTAIVGERGPEAVRSTPFGSVVTSRTSTAQQMSGPSVTNVINVDGANGDQHVIDLVRQGVSEGMQQAVGTAVGTVKENWGAFNAQFQSDGVLA